MNNLEKIINHLQFTNKENVFTNEKENEVTVNYANQICNNIFTYFKPWDMERCIYPIQLPNVIDWDEEFNKDEEWTFMLNRMSYLKDLILAYMISDDKKYSVKCKNLIFDWINSHKKLEYSHSTRTLDTAIRIETIFEVCVYLKYYNLITNDEIEIIYESIRKQVEYVKENYITKYRLSNWGSIQVMVILSLCPTIYHEENEIVKWAKEELTHQLNIQVNENGMHWEQSTMYHVEVLNYLLKMIKYRTIAKVEIEDMIYEVAYRMTDALFQLTLPNGYIDNMGDSDRTKTDDIFVLACGILNTNRWKTKELECSYDTIFTLGNTYYTMYKNLPLNHNFKLDCVDHDAGFFVSKHGDENDFTSTTFLNGTLGSGHGHCDNLHISNCYKGEYIFVDSGRYTYREDHPLRSKLKSMEAHNTVIIDYNPHSLPKGSWTIERFCKPLKNYVKSVNEIHYFEGALIDSFNKAIHCRKVIAIDKGIWFIVDEVECSGKHTLTSYFHFDPKIKIKSELNSYLLETDKIKMNLLTEGKTSLQEKEMSLNYNELSSHYVVNITNEFENEIYLNSILVDDSIQVERINVYQGDTIVQDNDLFSARKFVVDKTLSYEVIIFHKEVFQGPKIFSIEGYSFHGQAVVIKVENGIKKLFILRH